MFVQILSCSEVFRTMGALMTDQEMFGLDVFDKPSRRLICLIALVPVALVLFLILKLHEIHIS